MEFEFKFVSKINFCVIGLPNYCSLRSKTRTSAFIDLELELQPLHSQINVFLDLELELIFPSNQNAFPSSHKCCQIVQLGFL
jgi:hypothetical protein